MAVPIKPGVALNNAKHFAPAMLGRDLATLGPCWRR